jgi:signal transduction histidine kinase
VITGAIELLEQGDLSAEDVKALDRIRRATAEMKSTIEMFLCIAREADDGQYGERFLVAPLVDRAVEQQRYLLNGKGVDVEVHVESHATPVVQGHPQAFLIAVTNLVRNAFEHTPAGQGPITVRIREGELLVTNRRSGDDAARPTPDGVPASNGYGLGLGIVQRLCERNGWAFSLDVNEARVTARLAW